MLPLISKAERLSRKRFNLFIIQRTEDIPSAFFNKEELEFIEKKLKDKSKSPFVLNQLGHLTAFIRLEGITDDTKLEQLRKNGESLLAACNEYKLTSICLVDHSAGGMETLAIAEGLVLGNYQFLKYQREKADKENALQKVEILSPIISEQKIKELNHLCRAVYTCRSWINEPASVFTAEKLAKECENLAKESEIKIEILNKQKIEALKMGGLLAVNSGSADPPTFTIMEYKPDNALNKNPLVLVGKGVVYDTGGLSLKPTNFMTTMKSDMSGAAAVANTIQAVAANKLPVYLIALIPATDNRLGSNAYAPDDIITMMDGATVEVQNTDAEGRLILADALAYAKKYNPMLVIDIATLTGAATAALGRIGIAAMHNKAGRFIKKLIKAGFSVHERIAEFPFWDDYSELIKSDIADLKNIGGPQAGTITAGKFLEYFTAYPWIHLDIAGPAFLEKRDSYRTLGGTGVGIRLFYEFINDMFELKTEQITVEGIMAKAQNVSASDLQKRKRGRPRKAKSDTTPKKRGRPRKEKAVPEAKKRGRPAKPKSEITFKKRGRPKKVKSRNKRKS